MRAALLLVLSLAPGPGDHVSFLVMGKTRIIDNRGNWGAERFVF
jgi:hypothetical protein